MPPHARPKPCATAIQHLRRTIEFPREPLRLTGRVLHRVLRQLRRNRVAQVDPEGQAHVQQQHRDIGHSSATASRCRIIGDQRRDSSHSSQRNGSISSAASKARAIARFFGLWYGSQSRSSAKRADGLFERANCGRGVGHGGPLPSPAASPDAAPAARSRKFGPLRGRDYNGARLRVKVRITAAEDSIRRWRSPPDRRVASIATLTAPARRLTMAKAGKAKTTRRRSR